MTRMRCQYGIVYGRTIRKGDRAIAAQPPFRDLLWC
jgi:hypothetical protein